jgi:Catalase
MANQPAETHRQAQDGRPVLTTQQGAPVADDQNTLLIGERGPAALEDFHFREKIFHFDHERIPERVVHARGYGAHGYSEISDSLADITRASLFADAVVLALSAAEAEKLSGSPAAKDFVADAFAHCKFVGFTDAASPPLTATGVDKLLDEGFVQPENGNAAGVRAAVPATQVLAAGAGAERQRPPLEISPGIVRGRRP